MRILVSFEDNYRAYRDVKAAGITILRPHALVETTVVDEFEEETARFEPEVVICGRSSAVDSKDGPAWIDLSLDPSRPSNIRVGDRR